MTKYLKINGWIGMNIYTSRKINLNIYGDPSTLRQRHCRVQISTCVWEISNLLGQTAVKFTENTSALQMIKAAITWIQADSSPTPSGQQRKNKETG